MKIKMAKGWTTVETVNTVKRTESKAEKVKRLQSFNKLIDGSKQLTREELKKHGDNLFAEKKMAEDGLLSAFDEKKLKSDKLIKQALRIKKERDKNKNKNAKQNMRKVSSNKNKGKVTETTETPA